MNWLIDRNIQVGFLAVDSTNRTTPKVERDVFWNDPDAEIPYTEATANLQHDPYMGSAAPIRFEAHFLLLKFNKILNNSLIYVIFTKFYVNSSVG